MPTKRPHHPTTFMWKKAGPVQSPPKNKLSRPFLSQVLRSGLLLAQQINLLNFCLRGRVKSTFPFPTPSCLLKCHFQYSVEWKSWLPTPKLGIALAVEHHISVNQSRHSYKVQKLLYALCWQKERGQKKSNREKVFWKHIFSLGFFPKLYIERIT